MKLQNWIDDNNHNLASFSKEIDVSIPAVRRYCVGDRVPRPEIMARITTATAGAVTANDFYHRGHE